MISLQQRGELRKLANPQNYRITARGPQIVVTSKCLTAQFSNNEAGYWAALAWLAASWEARERAKDRIAREADVVQ